MFLEAEHLNESRLFLNKLADAGFDDKCKLVFDECTSNKISHFVIKFSNDFLLKVLKKQGLYHFTFFSADIDYERINSFLYRDLFLDFFDVLCKKDSSLKPDAGDFYPVNFEATKYFTDYYKYFDDKKQNRHYGLKVDNAIKFIKDNYNFISSLIPAEV